MCGIVGFFDKSGRSSEPDVIFRMTRALAHRGPDGEGTYLHRSVGLGHRRLSIIDLSAAANQPMKSADERYVLTYNGELYNFLELRTELEGLGVKFKSRTDSEVILQAFIQWGPKSVLRFNGMFAFAIYDEKSEELFLARDRYGIKPLYISREGGRVLFGSEAKAFYAHPEFKRKIDKAGLIEYMTFQNFLDSRTLMENVETFPPGHYALFGGPHKSFKLHRYWDFNFREDLSLKNKKKEVEEELDHLFVQAVKRQLMSDVEVGAYLSGGMDSAAITAVASREYKNFKTFTVGFDLHSASGVELGFDERERAEHLSYLFGTEQYEMVMKAGDMERVIPEMTHTLDEPRVGQSYPNYYAAKLASKFCKVVLAGVGGDEIFGGYPWRYYRAVKSNDFDDYVERYFSFWQRMIPAGERKKFFKPIDSIAKGITGKEIFKNVFPPGMQEPRTAEEYINHSLYFEAKTFLHGLLIVEDKLGMAHSIENRVPFLDNDLVDFAMKLPIKYKLGKVKQFVRIDENMAGGKFERYFKRTRDGKLILRKVLSRYIPKELSRAVKQGFSAPDASWFKGESIAYVKRVLFSKDCELYDYLDRRTVHRLVEDHFSGRENRRLLIWSLINLNEWIKQQREGKFLISSEGPRFQAKRALASKA